MARDPKTGKSVRVENLNYDEWYKKYVGGEKSKEKASKEKSNSSTKDNLKISKEYKKKETDEAIENYISGDGMWINNKLRG